MASQRMARTASQAKVSSACSGLRQPAWTVRPKGQLGVALLMPPTRMARATSSPTSHSASECEGLVRGPSVTLSEGQRWQHPCQGPPWYSVLCSRTQRWQHEMSSLLPVGAAKQRPAEVASCELGHKVRWRGTACSCAWGGAPGAPQPSCDWRARDWVGKEAGPSKIPGWQRRPDPEGWFLRDATCAILRMAPRAPQPR